VVWGGCGDTPVPRRPAQDGDLGWGGAVVIDAVGFDDRGQAREACLRAVVADADEAGVDRVLLVRNDTHADRTPPGPLRLARAAGATPTLRCAHADAEPLTVVAEILVWCWTRGGEHRRAIAPALTSVHLV